MAKDKTISLKCGDQLSHVGSNSSPTVLDKEVLSQASQSQLRVGVVQYSTRISTHVGPTIPVVILAMHINTELGCSQNMDADMNSAVAQVHMSSCLHVAA